MSGPFEQDWLCSTVRPEPTLFCGGRADGKSASALDGAEGERVAIEGIDLYGLKLAYYCVNEKKYENGASAVDPLFGEVQLETVDRAFWFTGYVSQLPPNVRTYQLQGIWGEDVVQLFVSSSAFRYFSTYGGSDRNTPEVHDSVSPRVGDIVLIPANRTFYEIVDVKNWEEPFGLVSRYVQLTLRVYRDTKRTVMDDPSIPIEDPIRRLSPSSVSGDEPSSDVLKLKPSEIPDEGSVDLFDWMYDFSKENR